MLEETHALSESVCNIRRERVMQSANLLRLTSSSFLRRRMLFSSHFSVIFFLLLLSVNACSANMEFADNKLRERMPAKGPFQILLFLLHTTSPSDTTVKIK